MWLDEQTSLYSHISDTTGKAATARDILLCEFSKSLTNIIALKKLTPSDPDYKTKSAAIKSLLPLWSPAALLRSRAAGNVDVAKRTGVMQMDFDYGEIKQYDIEELKQAVFQLPFVGFCGLSCSGKGFFALIIIKEPERLKEYAEHCFLVFQQYGIKPDTSKGRNVQDLRFISYDANMLIRENPEPLQIQQFKKKPLSTNSKTPFNPTYKGVSNTGLINKKITEILNVSPGNRWQTVQSAAYTLGGLNDPQIISLIQDAIRSNSAFFGIEEKYLKCAADCFREGSMNPLTQLSK